MPYSIKINTLLLTAFIITGCQHYQQPQPQTQPTLHAEYAPNQFSIQGKIGIKTPTQSGSAFFNWQQDNDTFNIELTGAFGIGKTTIQGNTTHTTLTSSKTGIIESSSPESLLKEATNWDAPITHLIQWVQAKPATTQANIQYDATQRIEQINEEGWQVNFTYNSNNKLPYKIVLTQPTTNHQDNRIIMVIENR